jgi:hypothetical protein
MSSISPISSTEPVSDPNHYCAIVNCIVRMNYVSIMMITLTLVFPGFVRQAAS